MLALRLVELRAHRPRHDLAVPEPVGHATWRRAADAMDLQLQPDAAARAVAACRLSRLRSTSRLPEADAMRLPLQEASVPRAGPRWRLAR